MGKNKGIDKSTVIGVLVMFAIAIPIFIIDLYVDSVFLSLLILLGIGLAIVLVVYFVMSGIDKVRKSTGTWKFPIEKIEKSCAITGVIDISSDDDFKLAYKMVWDILQQEKIPQSQYHRYMDRNTIEGYYQTMRSNPSWDSSEVMQKVEKCYDECDREKVAIVKTAWTAGKREKAKLIVSSYFTQANVDVILREGARLRRSKNEQEANKAMNELRKKEQDTFTELTKYAKLHGREKRVAMCYDQYMLCKQECDKLEKQRDNSLSVAQSYRREKDDWAIAGGIAQGIAGPAAGLATAMDVQRKNAEAREKNEQSATAFTQFGLFTDNKLREKKKELQHYAERVDRAKKSLVDDSKPYELFEKLHFEQPTIGVSETGTITVKISANAKSFMIYDDRKAVIDGSVVANIYEGTTKVGQAIMVFPQDGVSEKTCELEGIALSCGQWGKKYHATIGINDLWAIEK